MTDSCKKWRASLAKMVEDEGCEFIEIRWHRRHLKIYTKLPNGEEYFFTTSSSPSDKRAFLNLRSFVRQKIRSLNDG